MRVRELWIDLWRLGLLKKCYVLWWITTDLYRMNTVLDSQFSDPNSCYHVSVRWRQGYKGHFICLLPQFPSYVNWTHILSQKMADDADYDFASADAGASETFPMQCSALRKNGFVMIKVSRCSKSFKMGKLHKTIFWQGPMVLTS